jgi:hypothetical protein
MLHIHLFVPLPGEGCVQLGVPPLLLQIRQLSLVDVVMLPISAAKKEVSRAQLDTYKNQIFLLNFLEL